MISSSFDVISFVILKWHHSGHFLPAQYFTIKPAPTSSNEATRPPNLILSGSGMSLDNIFNKVDLTPANFSYNSKIFTTFHFKHILQRPYVIAFAFV
jgi:hypothetical protein